MPIPAINSWKLESLRLTVFLAEPIDPNSQGWWQSIADLEPETTTIKKQTGEHIEEGQFEDWRLTLIINSVNQNRVDWIAYPAAPALQGISSIGSYVDVSEKFYVALNNWLLTQCPSALRIAYGAVLLNETASSRSSYETLQSCLPHIKFNLDSWSDFSFQVNNKTASSALNGATLNIVSKWNAVKVLRIQVESSAAATEIHACRLELDLSTAVGNKVPIDSDRLTPLYIELRTIADKYASEGYQE